MPRLTYLNESTARVKPETLAALKARRNGKINNLDGMLIYSDPLTRGWNALFGAIRSETTLSPRISEIAILRAGMLLRASYEVYQHQKIALGIGMTETEIDAIGSWRSSQIFNESECAVLAYADAMTESVQVPDDVFAAVRRHFDERQIVELTATIAGYNMVSRFLEALQVTPAGE